MFRKKSIILNLAALTFFDNIKPSDQILLNACTPYPPKGYLNYDFLSIHEKMNETGKEHFLYYCFEKFYNLSWTRFLLIIFYVVILLIL